MASFVAVVMTTEGVHECWLVIMRLTEAGKRAENLSTMRHSCQWFPCFLLCMIEWSKRQPFGIICTSKETKSHLVACLVVRAVTFFLCACVESTQDLLHCCPFERFWREPLVTRRLNWGGEVPSYWLQISSITMNRSDQFRRISTTFRRICRDLSDTKATSD